MIQSTSIVFIEIELSSLDHMARDNLDFYE